MIRMGEIWDRTTATLAARGGLLASIALLLLFLPNVMQAAAEAAASGITALSALAGLLGILVAVFALWGSLALTAATSEREDLRGAIVAGVERLGPAVGVILIVVLAVIFAALPGIALIAASGFDPMRARAGLPQVDIDGGKMMLATLYFLIFGVAGLWVSARLVPLVAIVLNERRGVGAIGRSFALTRGSTLRLMGALLLFLIVLTVTQLAASSVSGVFSTIVFGRDDAAAVAFIVAVATAAVVIPLFVTLLAFAADFYLAVRARRDPA